MLLQLTTEARQPEIRGPKIAYSRSLFFHRAKAVKVAESQGDAHTAIFSCSVQYAMLDWDSAWPAFGWFAGGALITLLRSRRYITKSILTIISSRCRPQAIARSQEKLNSPPVQSDNDEVSVQVWSSIVYLRRGHHISIAASRDAK